MGFCDFTDKKYRFGRENWGTKVRWTIVMLDDGIIYTKVIIQVDLYQAEMAKVLTKGVEMWFFYKIIRFLETYALFLHTEP